MYVCMYHNSIIYDQHPKITKTKTCTEISLIRLIHATELQVSVDSPGFLAK